MRQVRPRSLRAALLTLLLAALLVGIAACAGSDDPDAAVPETTDSTDFTTTTAPVPTTEPPPVGTLIATAKVPQLTVVAERPEELGPSSTTSTAAPKSAQAPIPRVGLNSAGVRKVVAGYQFDNPTYFENPLVMQVLEVEGDWLKVLVQARPNHTEGWVEAADVDVTSTTYKMVLSLADRHLTVYDGDDVVAETDVVIGKPATPTPLGGFYLSEKIAQQNAGGAYGPWILSTNGYSEALDLFDSGLPVVAFHGTNQPNLIGTAASNGCIRMPNDVVTQLAGMLPAGTPIEIVAESLAEAPANTVTTLAAA